MNILLQWEFIDCGRLHGQGMVNNYQNAWNVQPPIIPKREFVFSSPSTWDVKAANKFTNIVYLQAKDFI